MFSLAQGFYRELTAVPERRVVVLGLGGSGKSSVLEWAKAGGRENAPAAGALARVRPTVGLNVARVRIGRARLLLWDLGGAAKLRPIWAPYAAQADALVWVVDCADGSALAESAAALAAVAADHPHLAQTPLLVLANKQDAPAAADPVAAALALDLLAAADARSQCVQPTSARDGSGIQEGLDWLAEQLEENTSPAARRTCIK